MITDNSENDILEQYRNISNKLKKRFLRKPNVTEACESFTQLAQYCEEFDMASYAGLSWIAAARCEGSLKNIPGETSCLTRAGRQFISAEEKHKSLGCPSPSNEHLQAALSCFAHASSRYPDKCPLNINLNLEIAEYLERLDKNEYVEFYLKNAVELAKDSLDGNVLTLDMLASYYIKNCDYMKALELYSEITSILEKAPKTGANSDTLLKCEICRVLLLLILRPAPQTLSPTLAQLLEKYTWADKTAESKDFVISDNMFILIQSLVLTCQSSDTSCIVDLESELWPMLSKEQRELLRVLVKMYS